MAAPVTIPVPKVQAFEVFKPQDATPGVWPIRWRFLGYDGATPIEAFVETAATDEMTSESDLGADALAAAVVEYFALGYDW